MSPRLALAIVVPGMAGFLWMAYLRWKDRGRPEPWPLLWATTGGGAVATGLALAGFEVFDGLGVRAQWQTLVSGSVTRAAGYALLIGLVEEATKTLPALAVALRSRHFDEPLDGFIYAGCAAIGFAMAESALTILAGDGGRDAWLAALSKPLVHVLFSAPWGLGLARFALDGRLWPWVRGFTLASIAHGLFDFLIAREVAAPFAAPALALGIWIWLLVHTPRLGREPTRRPSGW